MKKLFSILLFFFFGISFYQCLDCNCPKVEKPYFNINGFTIDLIGGFNSVITTSKMDRYDLHGFRINFLVSYLAKVQKCDNQHYSINNLLACSCIEPGYLGAKDEKIENIDIITIYDFDEKHPAGSSINEYISTYQINDSSEVLSNFIMKSNLKRENIDFDFLKLPSIDYTRFQFEIRLKVKDDEFYSVKSSEIIFK